MRTPSRFRGASQAWCLVVLAAAGLAGCGEGRPAPVKVRGQVVLRDGKPVANAQVAFHPAGGSDPRSALHPTGQTDNEGRFELTTFAGNDGAPIGEYAVTVTRFQAFKAGDEYVSRNTLPERYARPESSGLKATVTKDARELEPIQVANK